MRYVDTDEIVERDSRRRISDIFAEDGEPAFRELESEAVRKVSKLHNHVISTGGGVVLERSQYDRTEAKWHYLLPHSNGGGDL